MKQKLIAVVSAAMIGLTAVATPNKVEAHWHGGWWVPGAVIGGLALGGAIASRPYYYGPDTTGMRTTLTTMVADLMVPTITVAVPTIPGDLTGITADTTDLGERIGRA